MLLLRMIKTSTTKVVVEGYGTEEKSQKDQVVTASKPSKPLLT